MDEQMLWGILLILYVGPFWLWQLSQHSKIEINKKLYPGQASEQKLDSRLTYISWLWIFGLAGLLLAWKVNMPPLGALILLVGSFVSVFIVQLVIRRWALWPIGTFRFWFAGSVVWVVAVAAWYLVFGRASELREEEYFYLALALPTVSAFALMAWGWAVKKS